MSTPPDFQGLFESMAGLCLVLSPSLEIVAATDAYLAATRQRRAEILGRPLFEVFPEPPDEGGAKGRSELRASLLRVLQQERTDILPVQYAMGRPDGAGGGLDVRYWSAVTSPVYGAQGRLQHLMVRFEDVTALLQLQDPEPTLEAKDSGLRTDAAEEHAEVLLQAKQLQAAHAQLRQAQQELERWVEERTRVLRVTEEQLRHAQKMEAIGRLAGGVAHDFNNLLSVIHSCAELVQDTLPATDARRDDLEQIQTAANRASTLTAQLLAFSRQQVLQPRLLEVDAVVLDIDKMLRRLIGEDIELIALLHAGPVQVFADQGQLEQILVNLAVNARDAMPRGGQLTLETAVVELSEDYARQHLSCRPGPHVMLAVSDTGTGIAPEVKGRIFNPFFTTKEVGKGTGLGLSTVYGIVQQSGGCIWVYSELGVGTTFKVYLPLASGMPQTPLPSARRPGSLRGTETLLLVEDDELVRRAAVKILERRGYRVLAARSGPEALRLLQSDPARVHLLITDVVMPGMSGRELSAQVQHIRPGVRTLFMSGYTDDAVVRHGVLSSDVAFLQKPFHADSLALKVREVLDAGAS